MSGLLRITTKLRHAGPAAQECNQSANRRCLERLVRYPIFRNSHLVLSEIKSVMIIGGELIRPPDAPVRPVLFPFPATSEAECADPSVTSNVGIQKAIRL